MEDIFVPHKQYHAMLEWLEEINQNHGKSSYNHDGQHDSEGRQDIEENGFMRIRRGK